MKLIYAKFHFGNWAWSCHIRSNNIQTRGILHRV